MATLADRVAIVTGAGTGIGRAISIRLAQDGAKLAVTDINRDAADETLSDVHRHSPRSIALKMDVTSEAEIRGFRLQARSMRRQLHHLQA